MDELSNVNITIVTRDEYGLRCIYERRWDDICFMEPLDDNFEEIILILADGDAILYSRLSSGPITWNDVVRFFAYRYPLTPKRED